MKQTLYNSRPIQGLKELSQDYSKINPSYPIAFTDLEAKINDPKLVDQYKAAVQAIRRKLANS